MVIRYIYDISNSYFLNDIKLGILYPTSSKTSPNNGQYRPDILIKSFFPLKSILQYYEHCT